MHVLTSHLLIYKAERTYSACWWIRRSREPTVRCDMRKRDVLCPSVWPPPPHGMRYEWAEQLFGVWWPDVDWGDQSSGSEAQTDAQNTSVTRTRFEIYKRNDWNSKHDRHYDRNKILLFFLLSLDETMEGYYLFSKCML